MGVAATALSPKLLANCKTPFKKNTYCSTKAEADKNSDAKYLEKGQCMRVDTKSKSKKVCNEGGKITVETVPPKDSSSSHKSKTSSGSDSDSEKSKK